MSYTEYSSDMKTMIDGSGTAYHMDYVNDNGKISSHRNAYKRRNGTWESVPWSTIESWQTFPLLDQDEFSGMKHPSRSRTSRTRTSRTRTSRSHKSRSRKSRSRKSRSRKFH